MKSINGYVMKGIRGGGLVFLWVEGLWPVAESDLGMFVV